VKAEIKIIRLAAAGMLRAHSLNPRRQPRMGREAMRKAQANLNHGSQTAAVETEAAQMSAAEGLALEEFGRWLDGELEQLVARWVHLAAPNASRRERALRRMI
jgi:hypothetical protein